MRIIYLGSVALAVLIAGPAMAADLLVRAPAHKAPPATVVATAYNWTGFYVGAGFGYGMYNADHMQFDDATGVLLSTNATAGGRGWFGTVLVGADYQFSDRIVAGAFADYDFSRIKGDYYSQGTFRTGEMKHTAAWAVGGRIGWLATPQILTYVNGGYTQARFSSVGLASVVPALPLADLTFARQTYKGYFIGGGVEYMFAPGWFTKTEYRYADYRSRDVGLNFIATGLPTGFSERIRPSVQTIRSELAYKFNWGGPVVGTAGAAGMARPALKAAPPPAAIYSWTGFYVGAGYGYGMYNADHLGFTSAVFTTSATSGGRGWFGTVLVGADYQFSDRIVAGAFADYDFSRIKGDYPSQGIIRTGELKQTSAWAVGGRIGWLATPQILTYINGGYAHARFSSVDLAPFDGGVPADVTFAAQTYKGYFIGGGAEYMFAPGWFAKTEYRYADYRSEDIQDVRIATGNPTGISERIHPYVQTIRSELVYKFNWGGPVVARN
jgi:outer membrane immunogenic protein